jgi:hypothetical protein
VAFANVATASGLAPLKSGGASFNQLFAHETIAQQISDQTVSSISMMMWSPKGSVTRKMPSLDTLRVYPQVHQHLSKVRSQLNTVIIRRQHLQSETIFIECPQSSEVIHPEPHLQILAWGETQTQFWLPSPASFFSF